MTHWIHPDAEAELGDAAVYYATHASRAIAETFLAEYERVRDLIIENQHRGPHAEGGLRAYHFDRFPYTLIYADDPTHGPQILAAAHQSREPGYWDTLTPPRLPMPDRAQRSLRRPLVPGIRSP